MSGILQPIQDIMTLLATLHVTNGDAQTVAPYVRVWNNQVKFEDSGKLYDFPKPAIFVEVVNEAKYHELGIGFQSCDVGFRIHVVHEYYNLDGTFEQDLTIFGIRDTVVALLSHYQPTACGPMVRTGESQEYDHNNIYHYIIDFITHFIDSKGSQYDPATGKYIYSTPPVTLNLDVTDPRTI